MKVFKVFLAFLFLVQGCTAVHEREVRKYEDYFPRTQAEQNPIGNRELETDNNDSEEIPYKPEDQTIYYDKPNNTPVEEYSNNVQKEPVFEEETIYEDYDNTIDDMQKQEAISARMTASSSRSDSFEDNQGYKVDEEVPVNETITEDNLFIYEPKKEKKVETHSPTAKGKAYSDDGYFQEEPMPVSDAPKSTGKCRAVAAPGPKKIGKPYKINGITYYPMESADGYSEVGIASWYGPGFHGKLTANGEKYNQKAMTAAHKTLPLPTLVKVDNLENGKSVIVRVNDRGPYSKGRIIDLTEVAAERLGMLKQGTAKVRVSVLSEDPDCYISDGHEVNINKGNFAVQIGSFTLEDNAKRLADKYKGKAVISKSHINNQEWNKVWVTGFSSKEEALNAIDKEFKAFPGAFTVRYK